MMGSDFDESQSLKIAGSGFMDISFGFADKVIPLSKLLKLDAKVAAATTDAVCERIGTAKTVSLIRDDAREIMQKGMSEMSLTHCAFGSKEFEHEVHKLAKSLVKEGADPNEVNYLVGLIKEETSKRLSSNVQQKIRNELYKAGETSTLETGTELTKEAVLEPEKFKLDELGIKSTSDFAVALLKYAEFRSAGKLLGKTIDHANLHFAKRALFESAKDTMPKENLTRLIQHTNQLQERINNPKETAKTLREVTHFFRPIREGLDLDLDVLPKGEALRHRGEMTLFELANPEMIHQGMNQTCNATVVQKQLAFNAPHRYAQIAKDISCYDTFVTTDGTRLKPSSFGAHATDLETLAYSNKLDRWKTTEDLHIPHFRRPTEKAMQTMLINAHWNCVERSIYVKETPKGLLIVSPNTDGAVVKEFAAGKVAFFGTTESHQLCYKHSDEWLPFQVDNTNKNSGLSPQKILPDDRPHIGSEHLLQMYNKAAGHGLPEETFVLIGPAPQDVDSELIEHLSRTQTFVSDKEHLAKILQRRYEEKRGAAAIAIDAKKLNPHGEGGGHVILGRYNQLNGKYNIFNSEGRYELDLDLEALFDCLLEESFDGTTGQ